MSTFPTAFWKKQPAEEAVGVGTTITWETGLSWSYDTTDEAVGVTSPFPIKGTTSFPFVVDIDGYGEEEYYSSYGTATTTINKGTDGTRFADQVFYAWYLTGGYDDAGENDTSSIHESHPWKVGDLSARIDFEADYITAFWSGIQPSYDVWTKYNQFIQSGSATGSFTLGSTSNLTISVSGLGQDKNRNTQWADAYDTMTLHLYNGSTEELICSGRAPEDNRNLLEEELGWYYNYDMQQVKLYSGSDLENIVNYQGRHGGTVDEYYGAIRNNTDEFVDQDNRVSYVNSNGTGVFEKIGLGAGDYQIRIRASSIDGDLTSGAFYGFTFSFS